MKDSTYIFYCIIGRMKYYEGNCNADSIEGGGSHPSKDKHEIFNFKDISGKTYGFVQPRGRIIHIERIGGEDFKYADKIDDVLVIWVSPTGIGNGREIVGWYNHATVYREVQSGRHQKQRAYKNYNIVANTADCQLIPLEMRSFEVPQQKGYSGQANICPNCHAMLHKKAGGMPYTPEELKLIMQNVKKRNIDSYHDTLSL